MSAHGRREAAIMIRIDDMDSLEVEATFSQRVDLGPNDLSLEDSLRRALRAASGTHVDDWTRT